MLVECGFVRAVNSHDGAEFTFWPSFCRIADLGSPQEIVQIYAGLHGARAAQEAACALSVLCLQDDATALLGWIDEDGAHAGAMPADEQIIIARHLLQHGIVGKARPGAGGGKYSDAFNAHEYIAAACIHFGLTRADAENLSMTEFQTLLDLKFPEQRAAQPPSREAYRAFMDKIKVKG